MSEADKLDKALAREIAARAIKIIDTKLKQPRLDEKVVRELEACRREIEDDAVKIISGKEPGNA